MLNLIIRIGAFLILISSIACTQRLEKKLLAEEFHTEQQYYSSERKEALLSQQIDRYFDPFVSYLNRVYSLQRLVNHRIDSLETADNWPKDLEGFQQDDRFTVGRVSYGIGAAPSGWGAVALANPEAILSAKERSLLLEGLDQFPQLVQSTTALGKSYGYGIQERVSMVPDSILFVYDPSSTNQPFLPLTKYAERNHTIPLDMIGVEQPYPTYRSFFPQTKKRKEVPIEYALGVLASLELAGKDSFLANSPLIFGGLTKPKLTVSIGTGFSTYYVVLVAPYPLNTGWVISIPNKEVTLNKKLSYRIFRQNLDQSQQYELAYQLLRARKNLPEIITFHEQMLASGSKQVQKVVGEKWKWVEQKMDARMRQEEEARINDYRHLLRQLENRSNRTECFFARAKVELMVPDTLRNTRKVFRYLQKSIQHNPGNIAAYKELIALFPSVKYADEAFHEAQEAELKRFHITKDSLKTWATKVYQYGQDSLATYPFLRSFYGWPNVYPVQGFYETPWPEDIDKAWHICNKAVERFKGVPEAHNLRAEFVLHAILNSIVNVDRIMKHSEERLWRKLGIVDSLMPALYQRESYELTFKEPDVIKDPEERRTIRAKIDTLQSMRLALHEELGQMLTTALEDAEVLIDKAPRQWKGYWLRALLRYRIGEKEKAQSDICKAKSLYLEDSGYFDGTNKPRYDYNFYYFQDCNMEKL